MNFQVKSQLGETAAFRIYLGTKEDGKSVIIKVAKTFDDNFSLFKEASEFNLMRTLNETLSNLAVKEGKHPQYNLLFANLEASWLEPSQGDRRINVFTVKDDDLSKLTPLASLEPQAKIDARTSVWILGRFLKFYNFFELISESYKNPIVRYPLFSPDDFLINPSRHRLVYYNFSDAIADVLAINSVRAVADFMLGWIMPENGPSEKYLSLLKDFVKFGRETFGDARTELYALTTKLWGVEYYPFTYYSNDGELKFKFLKEE